MVFWVVTFVAGICGSWMIFDGVYVLRNGKYFGPDVPGPWHHLIAIIGFDPLKFGSVFIALGVMWLLATISHLMRFSDVPIVLVALASLWYIPFGTAISIVILGLILLVR